MLEQRIKEMKYKSLTVLIEKLYESWSLKILGINQEANGSW